VLDFYESAYQTGARLTGWKSSGSHALAGSPTSGWVRTRTDPADEDDFAGIVTRSSGPPPYRQRGRSVKGNLRRDSASQLTSLAGTKRRM
jgi:hypothetical protein